MVSLELQGGPMSGKEVDQFSQLPFSEHAVRLRRWDDQAKVAGLPTPNLDEFGDCLRQAAVKDD
jgi:predicted HD phosphohydrolase